MNDYVFREEFLEDDFKNGQDVFENEQAIIKNRGENILRLVVINTAIALIVVICFFALKHFFPKGYTVLKQGYNAAVATEDITFSDIKKLFSEIYEFVFVNVQKTDAEILEKAKTNNASSGIAQSEGAGGDINSLPSNVTDMAYVLTAKISPVTKGTVTSVFGKRIHPIFKTEGFHTGIDIAYKLGTPILSAFSGTVYEVGKSEAYGNYIIIKHSDTLFTFYGHCDSIKAREGMVMRSGEIIAFMGSTGYSTGPHLHFEIRIDGKCVDPAYVLKGAEGIEF